MAKKTQANSSTGFPAPLTHERREGFGATGEKLTVSKGSYDQVGTAAGLSNRAYSPNHKTGSPFGN